MNVKRLSKRTLAMLLSVILLLSAFAAGSVTTANAAWGVEGDSVGNLYVYFDNSDASIANNKLCMFVATDDTVYNSAAFGKVTNYDTLLYRNVNNNVGEDFSEVSWSDVTSVFFGEAKTVALAKKGNTSLSEYDNSIEKFKSDNGTFNNFTAFYSEGFTVSSKNVLYFSGSSSNLTGKNFGSSSNSKSYAPLNFSQKVFGAGDVSVDSYSYLSAASTVTTVSDNTTSSVDALYNTKVTLKATATAESGEFLGWYDNSSFSGEPLDSPTYTVTGENTYYAKFSKGLTASAGASEGGSVSVSDGTNSGNSVYVTSGTSVTFNAMPNTNYTFDGWYTSSDFSGSPESTLDPYTVTVDSSKSLYAKFTQSEADSAGDEDETAPQETAPSKRNNGKRDENSTSLSAQAKEYYTDEVKDIAKYNTAESGSEYVYKTFEKLADAETNDSSNSFDVIYKNSNGEYVKNKDDIKFKYAVQNSLFGALYDIMSTTHTHAVSYAAYGKNSLAHYWLTTDSSYTNASDERGVYTFFYSDVNDYNHENMQREHIWPKSKASYLMKTGLGGSDLHHLRPAYGKVNNIKSNWGFASIKNKSGWKNRRTVYWPDSGDNKQISLWRADDSNGETFIDVKDDVRGDVARILLYIYTRWREPNLYSDIRITDEDGQIVPNTELLPERDADDQKNTGERIIYDLPTLLDWMEKDPVSEWEMKRNDLTQDIQGNRNVFIDYPELAWMIFDKKVPSNMDTPSGMAKGTGTDISKIEAVTPDDPVTIDINTGVGGSNGTAEITARNNTTGKPVKNGDVVNRGDIITYTIIPDGSSIEAIRYNATSGGEMFANYELAGGKFIFTKKAGYDWNNNAGAEGGNTDTIKTKDGSPVTTETFNIKLTSDVVVLSIKTSSVTTSGNAGGSGNGSVVARYADGAKKNQMIENGEAVRNNTNVLLTMTPDYGSRYYSISSQNNLDFSSLKQISGTDSYQVTVNLSSINDKDSATSRTKTITVKFAQTFNSLDKTDSGVNQHINNKGMRPDEGDSIGTDTDFTTNFEICGVQIKKDEENSENKALRFVSVIDKDILKKAESYGYVIGYTAKKDSSKSEDRKFLNRYAYTLTKDGGTGLTLDCTGTSNTVSGIYGEYGTNTNYKYITAAINNIQEAENIGLDTIIIARPYVVLKDDYIAKDKTTGEKIGPSVIYGQYIDFNTGEAYCACSGSYNYITSLAAAQ